MAVTADWEVEHRGLTINGGTYSLVAAPQGLIGGVDVRHSDWSRVTRHGMIAGRDLLAGRTVTLQVEIAAPGDTAGFAAAAGDFAAAFALGQESEAPLIFRIPGVAGGGVRRVSARARRLDVPVDLSYYHRIPIATVELACTDPRIYDDAETAAVLTAATPSGGHGFDVAFDHGFGGLGSAGVATVTNSGTVAAPVTLRVNGPVSVPRLRNETTGLELRVNITMAAGEWLDLDSKNRTVILNGTANRYHLLTSAQWWELQPGANQLRFTADDPTGSTATATYRSAWA